MNKNSYPNFEGWIQENSNLATASEEELRAELELRNYKNPFPLHVFNDKIKPFLDALHKEYDLPRSFIGLTLLTAYSAAIGTCYHLRVKKIGSIYLPIWACLEGISSSGKSLVMNQVLKPLNEKQAEYDEEGERVKLNTGEYPDKLKQLIYRDSHVQTLIRTVMTDNPKGIIKDADEILEWINGMNQISRKEGTDEQFWMSGWNCRPYTAIRANNQKYHLANPFVNVIGGVQPSITYKLFKNDRETTGFIFRLLFAVPETIKIADVNLDYDMPEEYERIHRNSIYSLLNDLKATSSKVADYSNVLELSEEAIKEYRAWVIKKRNLTNRIKEPKEKEIHAGILGKIKEYCLRFAAILHVADVSYNDFPLYKKHAFIDRETVLRAIELAEYFFKSAANVTERVSKSVVAPPEVLRFASYTHAAFSFQKIGDLEFNSKGSSPGARKKKAERTIKKMIKEYPNVFRAVEK